MPHVQLFKNSFAHSFRNVTLLHAHFFPKLNFVKLFGRWGHCSSRPNKLLRLPKSHKPGFVSRKQRWQLKRGCLLQGGCLGSMLQRGVALENKALFHKSQNKSMGNSFAELFRVVHFQGCCKNSFVATSYDSPRQVGVVSRTCIANCVDLFKISSKPRPLWPLGTIYASLMI